jgi:hypothetical protein
MLKKWLAGPLPYGRGSVSRSKHVSAIPMHFFSILVEIANKETRSNELTICDGSPHARSGNWIIRKARQSH